MDLFPTAKSHVYKLIVYPHVLVTTDVIVMAVICVHPVFVGVS